MVEILPVAAVIPPMVRVNGTELLKICPFGKLRVHSA